MEDSVRNQMMALSTVLCETLREKQMRVILGLLSSFLNNRQISIRCRLSAQSDAKDSGERRAGQVRTR